MSLPTLDQIEAAEMPFDYLTAAELSAALLRLDLDRTTRRQLRELADARATGRGGWGCGDMYREAA